MRKSRRVVPTPSIERLREVLDYNPLTGDLILRIDTKGRTAGSVAQRELTGGYSYVMVDGKLMRAHRAIWALVYGEWPEGGIDHVDRDGTNNALTNLRLAGPSQNARNRIRRGKSGYKGVHADNKGCGRFYTLVCPGDSKLIQLGSYNSPEEAAYAFNVGAWIIDQRYSAMNIIPEGAISLQRRVEIAHKVTTKLVKKLI